MRTFFFGDCRRRGLRGNQHGAAKEGRRHGRILRGVWLLAWLGCCTSQQPSEGRAVPLAPATSSRLPASPPALARPSGDPASSGTPDGTATPGTSRPLDVEAVERLVADARANRSDALVLVKDGSLVGEWYFTDARSPIETMSVTKAVLSLAVGTLVDSGKLGLDVPISALYPQWRGGEKRAITLRHLLTHTSGLDEGKSTAEIYRQRDFVKVTLGSALAHAPGTHYRYSNRGANLVSGIVARVSRMPADRYVDGAILEPLGIRSYGWAHDLAGNAHGMAGLRLQPRDLARIGELVLDRGVHGGRRIVSEGWIAAMAQPGPVQPANKRLGLFWWLSTEWARVTIDDEVLTQWRDAGVDEAFIADVSPLAHRRFDSVPAFVAALRAHFGDVKLERWNEATWQRGLPDGHFEFGPVNGLYATGTMGQHLVVLPRDRLVAVRMRRAPSKRAEWTDPELAFPDFVERVQGLVRAPQ